MSTLTIVANTAAVVRWNYHKGYLRELASAGVPTVPTTAVTTAAEAEAALRVKRSSTVVVKPAVGIGGDDAAMGGADDPAMAEHLRMLLAGGDVVVQP